MSDAELNAIFRFRFQRPSDVQSSEFCDQLRELLDATVRSIVDEGRRNLDDVASGHEEEDEDDLEDPLVHDRDVPLEVFTTSDIKLLEQARREYSARGPSLSGAPVKGEIWTDRWFPEYAAVLQMECVSYGVVRLRLLGLDGWERVVHHLPGDESVHSAVPRTYQLLHCGEMEWGRRSDFYSNLTTDIEEAIKRTKNERHALLGDGPGHQKTPSFLCACIRTALTMCDEDSKLQFTPNGGMTDVGLHTGGASRDTCWPLVYFSLMHALPRNRAVFEKTMLRVKSGLIRIQLSQIHVGDDTKSFWDKANTIFAMLQDIVVCTTVLIDRGYVGPTLEHDCLQWRARLDKTIEDWNTRICERCKLPDDEEIKSFCSTPAFPRLSQPELHDFNCSAPDSMGREIALAEAKKQGFEVIDAMSCSAESLLAFLKSITPKSSVEHVLVGFRGVEVWMWGVADHLELSRKQVPSPENLREIVDWCDHFRAMLPDDSTFAPTARVTTNSKVLLVKWIAYCACHKACCEKYTELKRHKLALDSSRLSPLLLPEELSRTALKQVVAYIQKWNRQKFLRKPVFHFSDPDGTLDFSRQMCYKLSDYTEMYRYQQHVWQTQIQNQWNGIERRKHRVQVLREEISKTSNEVAALRDERLSISRSSSWARYTQLQELDKRIQQLDATYVTLESEKNKLLRLPEFAISPLPYLEREAQTLLFLMYIPEDLDILSSLTGLAQRDLGPNSWGSNQPSKISWHDHFVRHHQPRYSGNATRYTACFASVLNVPTSHGPASIDDVYSRDDFENKCAWYPSTDRNICLLWKDREDIPVDPFQIREIVSKQHFLAEVPSDKDMEWAAMYPGGPRRGNETYAKANLIRMASNNFTGYAALGSLRSQPTQQLRCVFGALEANNLDWSSRTVAAVVEEAVFQVGKLSEDSMPAFEWHLDLETAKTVKCFDSTLSRLLKCGIDPSPSKFRCIPLLGKLASFLDQFNRGARCGVRSLVCTARRFALEDRQKWMSGVSSSESAELRTHECLLYGFALTCYSFGPCSSEDLQSLCELVILHKNALLFSTGSLHLLVKHINEVVWSVVVNRMTDILDFVKASKWEIISSLCRLVNERIPEDLTWTPVPVEADRLPCCFEAVETVREAHYMVNLLTGDILTNGLPPTGLPSGIREHKSFQKLFGDQNFEVTSENSSLCTVRKIGGCHYRFRLSQNSLQVEESSTMADLQLCSERWQNLFHDAFPATVSELYSCWYWENKKCVLLRHNQVADRAVYFVIKFFKEQARCYEVPRENQNMDYVEIYSNVESYNVLIIHPQRLSEIIAKFEDPSFIHTFISPSNRLEIYLPRYSLRFRQRDDGRLESIEYSGYCLAPLQRLKDQLYRFERYLILECVSSFKSTKRLVVPVGRVTIRDNGIVDVCVGSVSGTVQSVYVYDEHPLLSTLSAESQDHRLQLAAVYAASSDLIAWSGLRKSGGHASMDLLSGCEPTRPLSQAGTHALIDLSKLTHLTPSSKIVVSQLHHHAQRANFLFPRPENAVKIDTTNELDALAASRPDEVICATRSINTISRRYRPGDFRAKPVPLTELPQVEVSPLYVADIELKLHGFLSRQGLQDTEKPFPLSKVASNVLGRHMIQEVEASWNSYRQCDCFELNMTLGELARKCRDIREEVEKNRKRLWSFVKDSVSCSRQLPKERIAIAADFVQPLTKTDVLRCALDKKLLLRLVPNFTKRSRVIFQQAARQFMELCVLKDKLERIILNAEATEPHSQEYFVDELLCSRKWSSREHPYWLVFEVEGSLQIRPEQYDVAMHLIKNPSSICQLNMGRGKTRVILPMLFLYYRFNCRDRIVRAHFLSPLLSETRQFMHRVLTAGPLRVPFVELPFDRAIQIGLGEVMAMQEAVGEMKRRGGFVMVAPEHRLSLELKRREIEASSSEGSKELCSALDSLLDGEQYIDIFDESDALLHHKYHLVYAVGQQTPLDGESSRWIAAEALFGVLSSSGSTHVASVLRENPDICVVQPEYKARHGAYDGLRLSTIIGEKSVARENFKAALIEDLIDNPPRELDWLNVVGTGDHRSELVAALKDPTKSCSLILSNIPPGREDQFLALRGLVAYSVLENCLEKRNRVNFGLPDPKTRTKDLAIPFIAADLPAPRSEFSHPDVSIVLTLLAYYHAGLTKAQILTAFRTLQGLDEAEREFYYDEWFGSVKFSVNEDESHVLCNLEHVSLDNTHQFEMVFKTYQFSMKVINFYVNRHVFPHDTKQYPQRLSRTAWDLVRGPHNIGFSGTNDTHLLLPKRVQQREPDTPALRGTNGKMIDLFLKYTKGFEVLPSFRDSNADPVWKQLLRQALMKKCLALIDTGALLGGVSVQDAAFFMMGLPDFDHAGVTYYDTRKKFDCWVVLERRHKLTYPLKHSPIQERDTFVIFDEARSRGSDMKLKPDALALLTLGPTITKDKLMQGAGRLRQLGRNQQLLISSTIEVQTMILRERDGCDIVDVLDWVIGNTQRQSTLGLVEWAQNGIQHELSQADKTREFQDEDWSLKSLYGAVVTESKIYDLVAHKMECTKIVETTEAGKKILECANAFGQDEVVCITGLGDECERELQLDQNNEVECEEPSLEQQPYEERQWMYDELFSATSVQDCEKHVQITSVGVVVKDRLMPSLLHELEWDSVQLFGTENFWTTIMAPLDFEWNGFMRMVDAIVVFEDGSALLLAEGETDAVLQRLLLPGYTDKLATRRGRFGLVHLNYAHRTMGYGLSVPLSEIPLSIGFDRGERVVPEGLSISVEVIVMALLLNGETNFGKEEHSAVIERVLRRILDPLKSKREETLRTFLEKRRLLQRWSMSFLHRLCERMDLEDWKGSMNNS